MLNQLEEFPSGIAELVSMNQKRVGSGVNAAAAAASSSSPRNLDNSLIGMHDDSIITVYSVSGVVSIYLNGS